MRTTFRQLPGEVHERPVLSVVVEVLEEAPIYCLVDTGTTRTRLPGWIAEVGGIDLTGAPTADVRIDRYTLKARNANVQLRTSYGAVSCSVWFVEDWQARFGLLGTDDFLAQYRLEVCASEAWFLLREEGVPI